MFVEKKSKKRKRESNDAAGKPVGIKKCVTKRRRRRRRRRRRNARVIIMTDQQQQQQMTPEQREQAFAMANQEMEYRVDLFNKLVHSCYEKCIDKRFKDGDLNVGETACVDRCSSKYWQSVGIVGQLLGANQQQQQQ